MSILPPLIQAFVAEIARKHNPKVKVFSKDTSSLMKFFAFFLKPFNPKFMEGFITTIGTRIYIPSKLLEIPELKLLDVIAHETQHIIDFTKNRPVFLCGYLFPQCLALLSVLTFLAFFNSWMWLWLLALVFLAPIPAVWRYKYELNGYRTSILFAREVHNYTDEQMSQLYKWIETQFTSGNYFYAFPFPRKIAKDLKDETFMTQSRYIEIVEFLKKYGKIP